MLLFLWMARGYKYVADAAAADAAIAAAKVDSPIDVYKIYRDNMSTTLTLAESSERVNVGTSVNVCERMNVRTCERVSV
jgi:hypothetical protein